jgi:glycosyltransferase involved in cell wall biosynthesis
LRVHERYGVPLDRIDAIWLGADEVFRPLDAPDLLASTRRRYVGDDRPCILFVGGLSRRRNVPMLIQAFGLLKARHRIPHRLLLVGSNRAQLPLEELARQAGVEHDVVQTDGAFTHHRELVPIYNAADVFVLPSSSEGFSLTLAEAMSCGTPVVTVNRASLGEVAHGYGMTIDEPDVEALADALYRVLASETVKRDLRAKSLERAQSFRWADTARRTLDVLRRVAHA